MCALGLCTLLQKASTYKRPDVAKFCEKILPSICLILENLDRVSEDKYDQTEYSDGNFILINKISEN